MLLRHKLAIKSAQETNLIEFLKEYLSQFKEVATLIFDIAIYLTYISEKEASTLVEQIKKYWELEKDLTRKCRLLLNLCKLRKILSSKFPVFSIQVNELQTHYFSSIDLDGKPEKGERKLADDFVVLINEICAENKDITDSWRVQLVSLNEYALHLSPYNFDIQMAQANLFDGLGMSVSFAQSLAELNLKGVQCESLGYLHVKHTLKYGTYDSIFRSTYLKYLKYDESNTYDLSKLKSTSLAEENFDQIENFVEYEQYLKLSYFSHV